MNQKNIFNSYLIWFFLGLFGGHRFYLEDNKNGKKFLILTFISIIIFLFNSILGMLLFFAPLTWWCIDSILLYSLFQKYTQDKTNKIKIKK